jgi:hypothetical protein
MDIIFPTIVFVTLITYLPRLLMECSLNYFEKGKAPINFIRSIFNKKNFGQYKANKKYTSYNNLNVSLVTFCAAGIYVWHIVALKDKGLWICCFISSIVCLTCYLCFMFHATQT